MRIAGLISPTHNGCDWWRILLPLRSLLSVKGITVEIAHKLTDLEAKPDIVLVNRNYNLGPIHLNYYHQQGIQIVTDWDDDLFSHRATLAGFKPELLIKGLEGSDLVTCTTEYLARKLRPYNSNVKVISNLFWPLQWQGLSPRPKDRLVIGAQTSAGHRHDWDPLPVLFGQLALKHPDVHFLLVMASSVMPDWFAPLKAILGERLQRLGDVAVDQYQQLVNKIDIGICMLDASDPFNHSKSPIKWIEHALCNAPCVVSPTVYGNFVGNTALIAETPDEWLTQLSRLIEDNNLRRKLGQRAREHVQRNYSLTDPKWQRFRLDTYRSLLR